MNMKWHYDPTTREPITGVLPASVQLPHKTTPPPEPGPGQYVLAKAEGAEGDWELVTDEAGLAERQGEIERQRRIAYADPVTGSDRLFSEAYRMQLMGEPDWEQVRDQAIARFHAIQAEYPWTEG
jgi:hypothetical protein